MSGVSVQREVGRGRIRVEEGDLTRWAGDAIVNAANGYLQHGGGVAGAIVRRGGTVIQEESDRLAPIGVGEAVLTTGGALAARHVIHAVGPRMGEGDEDAKLGAAARSALAVAEHNRLRSLAFPAISAGIFGFPIDRSAAILIAAASDHLLTPQGSVVEITFCLWGEDAYRVFEAALLERIV